MFRRRKRDQQPETDPQESPEEGLSAPDDEPAEPSPPVLVRPRGPWDVTDAPDSGIGRLDLGGLQVPVPPDTEIRVEVSPEGEVMAATMVQENSQMQVNAFAAPRTMGIWQEVCEEIAASLVESGGQAEQRQGSFGVELHALVPTEVPGQGVGLAPVRFVGVDGPRWFLRALFSGAAAVDAASAAPLEAALRDVVVVRGSDPMAVRDPLPLRLPKEAVEQEAPAGQEIDYRDASAATSLPERGPEITETR